MKIDSNWNDVNEVLPLNIDYTTVQVLTFGYDDWYVSNFFENEFYSRHENDDDGNSLNISKYITHWQYLPEIP